LSFVISEIYIKSIYIYNNDKNDKKYYIYYVLYKLHIYDFPYSLYRINIISLKKSGFVKKNVIFTISISLFNDKTRDKNVFMTKIKLSYA
jgi:hypothetical protein